MASVPFMNNNKPRKRFVNKAMGTLQLDMNQKIRS